MVFRINQNIDALSASRNLRITNELKTKSLERTSSGLRINRASDDAAGLGISEKLRAQIIGIHQAQKNVQDGISLIQTAEGALSESSNLLIRMRELSVQAASDYVTIGDRANIVNEMNQLVDEIDRISESTEFNTIKLLDGNIANMSNDVDASIEVMSGLDIISGAVIISPDNVIDSTYQIKLIADGSSINAIITGSAIGSQEVIVEDIEKGEASAIVDGISITIRQAEAADIGKTAYIKTFSEIDAIVSDSSLEFHIGANAGQTISIGIKDMSASSLGIGSISADTSIGAQDAIAHIDRAISYVADERSTLGAMQNRMEHIINSLSIAAENFTASESGIRDIDMASEMTELTRHQIMVEAAVSMLAQANISSQTVLQLLG